MFVNLVDEWLKTDLGKVFSETESVAIKLALVYFANWLDSRSPTTRAADLSTIELLRRISGVLQTDESFGNSDLVKEINAVLKTADGG